jgi:hypothetical protein
MAEGYHERGEWWKCAGRDCQKTARLFKLFPVEAIPRQRISDFSSLSVF